MLDNSINPVIEFYPKTASALLHLDHNLVNLETKKEIVTSLGLHPKDEFHSTIIGFSNGKQILDALGEFQKQKKEKLLLDIDQLLKSFTRHVELQDDYYLIEKTYTNPESLEIRKSLIQLVKIQHISEFYMKLNSLLGKNFTMPMSHITLYTTSTEEVNNLLWIGIPSKEAFERLCPQKV
jgi:hypothetical protein